VGGLIALVGLGILGFGSVGLLRGRIGWARITNRTVATIVSAAGLAVLIAGGALLPQDRPTTLKASATPSLISTTPTTSAAPTSSPRATTTAPSPSRSSPTASALTGLFQTVPWLNEHEAPATPAACAAAGAAEASGTERAWRLSGGALLCVDDWGLSQTWQDHLIAIDVYFPSAVTQEHALDVARTLLPLDSRMLATFGGVNNSVSSMPDGSCMQAVYASSTLKRFVLATNPQWTTGSEKASISLYSRGQTADGADSPYSPTRVHLASVTIGGENRGSDGAVHC